MEEVEDAPDRCRLAGSVRAYEPEDLTGADPQIDPPDRLKLPISLRQSLDDQGLLGNGSHDRQSTKW